MNAICERAPALGVDGRAQAVARRVAPDRAQSIQALSVRRAEVIAEQDKLIAQFNRSADTTGANDDRDSSLSDRIEGLTDEVMALDRSIAQTPAKSLSDVSAKLAVLADGDTAEGKGLEGLCIRALIDDVRRLSAGSESAPHRALNGSQIGGEETEIGRRARELEDVLHAYDTADGDRRVEEATALFGDAEALQDHISTLAPKTDRDTAVLAVVAASYASLLCGSDIRATVSTPDGRAMVEADLERLARLSGTVARHLAKETGVPEDRGLIAHLIGPSDV